MRRRRTEERVHIYHDVCGEFERTRDMVRGLLCIVAHDEGIRGERF